MWHDTAGVKDRGDTPSARPGQNQPRTGIWGGKGDTGTLPDPLPSVPRASSRLVPAEEPPAVPGVSPQAISIKSERVSPGLGCPPGTPQPPLAPPSEAPRAPGDPRDDFPKPFPLYALGTPRDEQRVPAVPTRRGQPVDVWQR